MQPGKPLTTHKFLPPGYKPPKLVPKPGTRLDRSDQRALRWYAAKDQWHAITHNGEPGTELQCVEPPVVQRQPGGVEFFWRSQLT